MSKRVMLLVLALGLLLPSLACICLPTGLKLPTGIGETATAIIGGIEEKATELATTPPAAKTPTPTLGPEESVVPSAGCFADLPEYPGAKRDREKEAELESLAQRFGPGAPPMKGEGRVYIIADPLKKVIEFYEEEMPKRGWERRLALTSDEGGIMLWEKGGFAASFIIGRIEEENLLLIGCNPTEAPLFPPSSTTPRFYAGPDLSEDGVELTNFSVEGPEPARVGDTLVVRFTVRNTTNSEMKFAPYGVLVGCRDPDDKNRDFGHGELTLKPQATFEFEAAIEVDKPGIWHFWPGYYLNGHWGPYKWQEIRVEVK